LNHFGELEGADAAGLDVEAGHRAARAPCEAFHDHPARRAAAAGGVEEAGGAPARHRLRLLLARREGAAVGLVLGGDALALAGGKVARHLAQELAALARRQIAQQGAGQTLDFGQIVAGHASGDPSVGDCTSLSALPKPWRNVAVP
jgi:hypothetical protein